MQTDMVVVECAASGSYVSVVAHSDPVSVYDRKSSGGPTLPLGGSGPPPAVSRVGVVHGISCGYSLV